VDLESYELKTDREHQWTLLESSLKREGHTRKEIKQHKDCFLFGKGGDAFGPIGQFYYYTEPTFQGWQRLFDEELKKPVSDGDFRALNRMMAGQLSDYFFGIEDQYYYFKVTYGSAYDPERKFPLRVNQETDFRPIVLTVNDLFMALIRSFSRWMLGRSTGEEGLLRFNMEYFESLLPHIDTTPFQLEELTMRDRSPGFHNPYLVQVSISNILKFGFTDGDPERVQMARKVTDIMMDYADELRELREMYDQAKKDAKTV